MFEIFISFTFKGKCFIFENFEKFEYFKISVSVDFLVF